MQVFSEKHATPARLLANRPAGLPAAARAAALELGEPRVGSPPRWGWKLPSEPSSSCRPASSHNEEPRPQASFSNVSPLHEHRFCTLKFPLLRNFTGAKGVG